VANIIGTGVFTTTGFMVNAIPSPPAVLLAWLLGGVAATAGRGSRGMSHRSRSPANRRASSKAGTLTYYS
jgi:L-asparagine transporter-like permease